MQFQKIFTLLRRFWAYVAKLGWRKVSIGVVVILVLIVVLRSFLNHPDADVINTTTPLVTVSSVAELSSQSSPLSIAGTVSSESEATVRAESSGAVTAVNHSLGQYVSAGTIVAELEDSSQRAALLQAQGALDAAQANLNRVQGPSGASAKTAAVNALLSAYGTFDSAIKGTADTMITNPNSASPQFFISSSNSQLISVINSDRLTVGPMSARESVRAQTLSTSDDLNAELTTTLSEVRLARTFFDTILSALNNAIPIQNVTQADIDADIAASTATRASLTSTLSALAAAQTSLSTSAGGTMSSDVQSAQAGVTQAQGGVAAARANLEKSIIRAPISGTINSFSLKLGDFVEQTQSILTVANNGALEILAYLTQQDSTKVSPGQKVTIEGGGSGGVVTHVAPAIDPNTKKIEVRVAVNANSNLINGQSVIVNFPSVAPIPTKAPSRITIPITALKIGATENDVFTVASTSPAGGQGTLVAHPVSLGELLGDQVVITSGLTPDMLIVTDARGLRSGEVVTLAQ